MLPFEESMEKFDSDVSDDPYAGNLSPADNKLRLKAARTELDNLKKDMAEIKQQNGWLISDKAALLNKTSKQIEIMRDKMENMAQTLVERERTIKELIHINKEGYNPDDDQKSEVSWMGISNSVKNGIWTFGRSKFSSTPKKNLMDTQQAKIDLAISASLEIERLRSIIKALSSKKSSSDTKTGGGTKANKLKNGLINGIYPGTH